VVQFLAEYIQGREFIAVNLDVLNYFSFMNEQPKCHAISGGIAPFIGRLERRQIDAVKRGKQVVVLCGRESQRITGAVVTPFRTYYFINQYRICRDREAVILAKSMPFEVAYLSRRELGDIGK
jgi:hypothetical protein